MGDYEIYKALHQIEQQEAEQRRNVSNECFIEARRLAMRAGLTLVRHTETHYALESPMGWLINIYPGNRRLYADRNRKKSPFLKLIDDWTLIDVVKAASTPIEIESDGQA